MASLFGKGDGYTRVNRSPDRLSDSDEQMLINVGVTEDQATFDFRANGDANATAGTMAASDEPGTITVMAQPENDGSVPSTSAVEGYGNTSMRDVAASSPKIHKQFSVIDYQANVETEENLKYFVSSFLFIAIVVVLIVVAFLFNPPV